MKTMPGKNIQTRLFGRSTRHKTLTGSRHEQTLARAEQNAATRDAGASNRVAQGTSEALRLPRSAEEPVEISLE